MGKRRGASTGIDVGTESVKLVRLESQNGTPRVTHWGAEPRPEGDSPRETMAEALRALLRRLDLSARHLGEVATAVGGARCVVRQVTVPDLSEADLRKSLPFEARKHLPLENMTDPCLDFQILGPEALPEGQKGRAVLLAAAPRGERNDLLGALAECDIDPDVVDIHPLPAVNAVLAVRGPLDRAVGVLDLGAASRNLAVVYPGGELYTRRLEVAGEANGELTQALVRHLGDTLRFLNTRHRERTLEELFVCGGHAAQTDLVEALALGLGITVLASDPFGEATFSGDAPSSPERATLVSAAGLAHRGDDV